MQVRLGRCATGTVQPINIGISMANFIGGAGPILTSGGRIGRGSSWCLMKCSLPDSKHEDGSWEGSFPNMAFPVKIVYNSSPLPAMTLWNRRIPQLHNRTAGGFPWYSYVSFGKCYPLYLSAAVMIELPILHTSLKSFYIFSFHKLQYCRKKKLPLPYLGGARWGVQIL